MTHAEMDELYELYALGVLEPELGAEIEQHLEENCAHCITRVREASSLVAALPGVAPSVEPPASLRARIVASVKPPQRAARWAFAVAALSAACLVLLVYSFWSSNDLRSARAQLASLTHERNELRSAVEILSRPETRAVEFGKSENVPHGRVLVNRSGGLVFVGSQLPALAGNRTFELWLIPAAKGAAPQPAGIFRPDSSGNSVDVSPIPVNTSQIAAVAVSVEPPGGSSAPTTTPILVVPIG